MGKSRLALELVRRARLRGTATYIGRAVETGGEYPYQPWVALLRLWADQNGLRSADALQRHVAEFVPQLSGSVPLLAGLLALAPPAARDRDQLWETFSRFLGALSAERPAVVVLEDLHVADRGSLNLLRFLLPEVRRHRLLLLATGRPEPRELVEMAATSEMLMLGLEPLAPAEIEHLTSQLLVRPDEVRYLSPVLLRDAGGNPLFVAELLKLLKAQGILEPRGCGFVLTREATPTAIPEGMRAVILRRLDRLSPEEREAAEIASVAGDTADAELLISAMHLDRVAALRLLQALERRHHLLTAAQSGRFRFVHDRVRELLYGAISPELCAEYHAIAARALATSAPERSAALVAHHFELSGDRRAASLWHQRAAEHARRSFAHEAAADHLDRALALDPGSARPLLLVARADVAQELGQLDVAEHHYREVVATQEIVEPPVTAGAWLGLARLADHQGDAAGMESAARRGLELLEGSDGRDLAARLASVLAHSFTLRGDHERASQELERAVALSRACGGAAQLSHTLLLVSRSHVRRGNLERARTTAEEALREARDAGDPSIVARALLAHGSLERACGNLEAALNDHENALVEAERFRATGISASVRINLAMLLNSLGRFPEALEHSRLAAEHARRSGVHRQQIAALVNGLEASSEMGELASGLELIERALALREHTDAGERDALGVEHGVLLCELGRFAEGQAQLEEMSRNHSPFIMGAAGYRLGLLFLELKHDGAQDRLQVARDLLLDAGEAVLLTRVRLVLARAWTACGKLGEAQLEIDSVPQAAFASLTVKREHALTCGELMLASGEPGAARKSLAEALRIAEQHAACLREVEARILLAAALRKLEDPVGASVELDTARARLGACAATLPEADRSLFLSRPLFSALGMPGKFPQTTLEGGTG